MTLSILQPNSIYTPPLTLGDNRNQQIPAKTDTAQNQWTDDTSGSSRTRRATPRASSQVSSPSSYSNKRLLQEVKNHFNEYAAGAGDKYVNFNELKEAAGLLPTTRTFSTHASAVAKELLNRSRLLNELDIGVGFTWDGRGLQDQRFDHANLDSLINRLPNKPRIRFVS